MASSAASGDRAASGGDDSFYARLQQLKASNARSLRILSELHRQQQNEDSDAGTAGAAGRSGDAAAAADASTISSGREQAGRSARRAATSPPASERSCCSSASTCCSSCSTCSCSSCCFEEDLAEAEELDWEQLWEEEELRAEAEAELAAQDGAEKAASRPPRARKAPATVHSITVPQPFDLTAYKPKLKTRSQRQLELDLARKKLAEEAEEKALRNRPPFRALPVPAHTYEQRVEDEETAARRRQRRLEKEASARLQTTVQPFSFEEREAAKQREKEEEARARAAMTPPSRFRARPIPAAVIDPYGWDRLQQEEDYRRLHAQFRAEEALLEARAPNDLDVRGSYLSPQGTGRRVEHCHFDRPRFQPKIHHRTPDFKRLHNKLEREQRHRRRRPTTAPEPFFLRTELIPSRKKKIQKDIEEDEARLPEQRWPFTMPRTAPAAPVLGHKAKAYVALGEAATQPMARPTRAAILREEHVRQSLDEQQLAAARAAEQRRQQQERQAELRSTVASHSAPNDHRRELREAARMKKKVAAMEARMRESQYQLELEDMYRRLEERPLLFEQQLPSARPASTREARPQRTSGRRPRRKLVDVSTDLTDDYTEYTDNTDAIFFSSGEDDDVDATDSRSWAATSTDLDGTF